MTSGARSVLVLGTGTMGAAACMHLAARGARVTGIDRFAAPHPHGSHHGGSRIVRECYFEHPDYVPLLLCARDGWTALEHDARACGAEALLPVVHRPGVLYLGAAGSEVVERSLASGRANGIACERLDARAVRARYPQFEVPDGWCALLELGAGFARPERAVEVALRVARARGAEIREHERAIAWEETAHGVCVRTDLGIHEADALIITAGAWTPALAAQLGIPLVPQRVPIAWLAPRDTAACTAPRMPVWYVDRPGEPGLYGVPLAADQGEPAGVKVAFHAGTPCDPDAPRTPPTHDELDALRAAVARAVPCAAGAPLAGSTCLYTMSPDGHFVVDRMPGCARTWVACGFSGHGFKFMPAIGEALADLALDGRTLLPVGFLGVGRLRGGIS
jgi:sarcosine oxidase